jgi:hypothetical protein
MFSPIAVEPPSRWRINVGPDFVAWNFKKPLDREHMLRRNSAPLPDSARKDAEGLCDERSSAAHLAHHTNDRVTLLLAHRRGFPNGDRQRAELSAPTRWINSEVISPTDIFCGSPSALLTISIYPEKISAVTNYPYVVISVRGDTLPFRNTSVALRPCGTQVWRDLTARKTFRQFG